jgi:DNA-binding transcriptional MocR family regulator
MHGGLPPADVFPFVAVEYTFSQPLVPPANSDACAPGTPGASSSSTLSREINDDVKLSSDGVEQNPRAPYATARLDDTATLATLQQYSSDFSGYQPLRQWLTTLMQCMQQPVHRDWGVLLACNAMHSIELVLRTFLNPGETLMAEEFIFSQVLEGLAVPMGLVTLGVAMDGEGMEQLIELCMLLQNISCPVFFTEPAVQAISLMCMVRDDPQKHAHVQANLWHIMSAEAVISHVVANYI